MDTKDGMRGWILRVSILHRSFSAVPCKEIGLNPSDATTSSRLGNSTMYAWLSSSPSFTSSFVYGYKGIIHLVCDQVWDMLE
jgi:hypothetical protein